jgi:hypothetical protein
MMQIMKEIDRKALLITNLIIDGMIIFLLFQLLCFHTYLAVKNMTTYEFIIRNKIKPIAKKQSQVSDTRPGTGNMADPNALNEQSAASVHDGRSEALRLMEPLENPEKNGEIGFSASKKALDTDPLEEKREVDTQNFQQIDSTPKEQIIKPKPRRSGAELKPPR